MTLEIESVINKIKKCLALSKSSNEHEAATALRQAQKLMAAYNVTDEAIAGAEIGELDVDCPSAWRKPPQWEIDLVHALCHAFGGKFLLVAGYKGVLAKFRYIGLKHQAPLVQYAYQVVRRQCSNARTKYLAEHYSPLNYYGHVSRGEKIVTGEAFCRGYVDRLRSTISKFAMGPEFELLIEQKVASFTRGKYEAPKRAANWAASEAGAQAGAKASLYRPFESPTKPHLLGVK